MNQQLRKFRPAFVFDYFIAALLYCLLNVAVFHSGLYGRFCTPDSYAGQAYARLSILEEIEKRSGRKAVALIGDSTTEHGIGASELSEALNQPVANLAMPGTGPLEWVHYLRSIDPNRNRFQLIVMLIPPHNMRSFPHEDGMQTLIPVASIPQMISYTNSFQNEWFKHLDHYYAAFDRLYGFRRDLSDLFLNPSRLKTQGAEREELLAELRKWNGQELNVCSTQVDMSRGRVVNWGGMPSGEIRRLSGNAVRRISQLNSRPAVSGIIAPVSEIVKYYNDSTTQIAIVSIPFGLGHKIRRNSGSVRKYFDAVLDFSSRPNVIHWDATKHPIFDNCVNFYDFRHLNAAGRKLFTAELAAELQNSLARK